MRGSIFLVFMMLMILASAVRAADKEAPRRRAKPPRWSQEVRDVFFEDARDALVGARRVGEGAKPQAEVGGTGETLRNGAAAWSDLIEAETLQSEIKQVINRLAGAVSTSGKFSSGGHQQCQRDFSLLAVLFGVVEDFDEQVRWQREAGSVRRRLEQVAALCEEASEESYTATKQMQEMLTDLLRGQSPPAGTAEEDRQVDRSQLMLRLEQAVKETLAPALSNKKNFRRRDSEVAHESQLLAVLAKVIVREGYESSDDEEFAGYARQLGEASRSLAEAAKENNYEAGRSALGRLTQSCSACHEDFRG